MSVGGDAFRELCGRDNNTVVQSWGAGAAPSVDAQNNHINVDTNATKRKKKAMGKKSLIIGNGADASGGGTTGTGLNLQLVTHG